MAHCWELGWAIHQYWCTLICCTHLTMYCFYSSVTSSLLLCWAYPKYIEYQNWIKTSTPSSKFDDLTTDPVSWRIQGPGGQSQHGYDIQSVCLPTWAMPQVLWSFLVQRHNSIFAHPWIYVTWNLLVDGFATSVLDYMLHWHQWPMHHKLSRSGCPCHGSWAWAQVFCSRCTWFTQNTCHVMVTKQMAGCFWTLLIAVQCRLRYLVRNVPDIVWALQTSEHHYSS